MKPLDAALLPGFAARRYSYGAVLVAAGLGWAVPGAAAGALAPALAVGAVLLGVAHGACDQFVLPGRQAPAQLRSLRYWLLFLGGYLGLAGAVLLLWWRWPAATVALFFALTAWHWGSADAPPARALPTPLWLAHSLLRGGLLFAVPALRWPAATLGVLNDLLGFAGAAPVPAAAFGAAAAGLAVVVAVGHLALWAAYALGGRGALVRLDALEIGLLAGLLVALPPLLSVSVYFIFWHSLQHVLRLGEVLGFAPAQAERVELGRQFVFFLRRAWPLLLVSCVGLLVLGTVLAARLPNAAAWFSFALVAASVVTLPHALLVTLVLDAPRWRRGAAVPAASATAAAG